MSDLDRYDQVTGDMQGDAIRYATTVLDLKKALHLLPISITTRDKMPVVGTDSVAIHLDIEIKKDLRDMPPEVLRLLVESFARASRDFDTSSIRDAICSELDKEALRRLQVAKDDLDHSIAGPKSKIETLQQALLDEELKI
jgi:hypothetical protein